ncbi:hypothetical protein CHS0354_003789 [Potamilus streckersoni]|uniref:SRCR domain-containing protein n=1 Tax=Potamilus streckersoni TaxID=2493646 RepID=A0AAE0W6T4_9BIVA|nr:hypothetical protein CHS0354_003789 [Potamilus streckersoni]
MKKNHIDPTKSHLQRTGSVIDSAAVPDGVDPIWLDDVSCVGTESTLFDCNYAAHTIGYHNCEHREDVGVQC